jgi:hypothetical protein
MNQKPTDANRPLRVLEKMLDGGLGAGNLGLIMSRPGTGKVAVLTSLTIDHAMDGRNTLHVAIGKGVSEVRAFDDEVLHSICERYDLKDRPALMTQVERHKQIYTFRDASSFTRERLRAALDMLADHAEFRPAFIEIEGWPDWQDLRQDEVDALKAIATEYQAEIWLTAQTHRTDELTEGGWPTFIDPFVKDLAIIMALEPDADSVPLRLLKVHDRGAKKDTHLEFDPRSMLLRWR